MSVVRDAINKCQGNRYLRKLRCRLCYKLTLKNQYSLHTCLYIQERCDRIKLRMREMLEITIK